MLTMMMKTQHIKNTYAPQHNMHDMYTARGCSREEGICNACCTPNHSTGCCATTKSHNAYIKTILRRRDCSQKSSRRQLCGGDLAMMVIRDRPTPSRNRESHMRIRRMLCFFKNHHTRSPTSKTTKRRRDMDGRWALLLFLVYHPTTQHNTPLGWRVYLCCSAAVVS